MKRTMRMLLGGAVAAMGLGVLPDASQAGVRVDVEVGLRYPAPSPPPACPTRSVRVWVEPVYRTTYERVWIEPVYRTVCQPEWREPVYRSVCESAWVPDYWETRTVMRYEGGRRVYCTERVLVRPGHYERVERNVMVSPGGWENIEHQELVSEGYWKIVERQEVIIPGHWEERVEPVEFPVTPLPAPGRDWRPRPLPGWDVKVSHDRHERLRY